MALCAAAAWPTFIFHGKVFAAVQTAWGLVCLAFLVGFIWSWIHYRQTFKTLRGLSDTQIHIKTTATTGRHVAKHARK
jgi:branched-subunit amino acid ABC-type transport system permease component